jgi:molybdate transport system substrate-binding protein
MRRAPLRDAGQRPARTATGIGRRRLLQALPAVATLAVAGPARAASGGEDLVLACDITLGPAMQAAADAYANSTGQRVNVFPTEPGLILPQLEHTVQNDIVVTQVATMDAAVQAGIVDKAAPRGAWRNRVVVAALRGAPSMPAKPIAATDPSPVSDMNGPIILARLGLLPAATLGVIDSDAVATALLDGTARAGLLHMTDLRAHPELQVISDVPDNVEPPLVYAAAVTNLARRPDPAAFVDFLMTSQGAVLLAAHGLEPAAS